jgi:hypothetical protein
VANPIAGPSRYPSSPLGRGTGRDRVLPATRALCAVIVPFLLVAFVLLYFWPSADDTGRLFAWRITPDFTSMMLASAYLGGAYFFVRAASAPQWHRIAGGFLPVVLFSGLLGVATVVHWDRFVHGNVAFWLWAGLYFAAPLLVLLAWWVNRGQSVRATADDVLLSTPEVAVITAVGVLACLTAALLFALPAWAATVWPWPLTPLTARVVGAIFALGFAAVQLPADRRWTSARLLVQVALIMLALMTVAAARSLADFAADRPLTWVMAVGLPGTLIGLAALYWRREFSRSGSRPAAG